MALELSKQAFDQLDKNGEVRKEINSVIDNAVDSMINTVNGFINYVLGGFQLLDLIIKELKIHMTC